ncbi:MAG: DUF4292 domain-containing protein [Chitinophagaceae bacterium]|nr:MAG: DUF4292 domain-containing protein [Chitinophagaceae bacterium]
MKFLNKNYSFPVSATGMIVMLTGLILSGSGCHTEKKIIKAISVTSPGSPTAIRPVSHYLSSDFILQKLRENIIPYQTFSAHARLDITTPNGTQSGIATYIRMQKDSAIWISIRPVLGIELVRILITPDSVKVINFFKKTITLRSVDSLQQLLHIPFDFNALQDLIVGNPPVLTDSVDEIEPNDSTDHSISFSCQNQHMLCSYLIDTRNYLLLKNTLSQKDTSMETRRSEESFGEYILTSQHPFSTKRHLVIQTGSETIADIKFSRIEFDKTIDFPFPEVNNFRRE